MNALDPSVQQSLGVDDADAQLLRNLPANSSIVANGLARLVAGQRAFADEFGLAPARVFSDRFDGFKDRAPDIVIGDWMQGGEKEAEQLICLFDDLIAHQLALVQALDATSSSVESGGSSGVLERGMLGRLTHWLRRKCASATDRTGNRYLQVVAPTFISAYVHSRECIGKAPASQLKE